MYKNKLHILVIKILKPYSFPNSTVCVCAHFGMGKGKRETGRARKERAGRERNERAGRDRKERAGASHPLGQTGIFCFKSESQSQFLYLSGHRPLQMGEQSHLY